MIQLSDWDKFSVASRETFLKILEETIPFHESPANPYRMVSVQSYTDNIHRMPMLDVIMYRPPSTQTFAFNDARYVITVPHEYFVIRSYSDHGLGPLHFYTTKQIRNAKNIRPLNFMTNHSTFSLCLNANLYPTTNNIVSHVLNRYHNTYWGYDYASTIMTTRMHNHIRKFTGIKRDDILDLMSYEYRSNELIKKRLELLIKNVPEDDPCCMQHESFSAMVYIGVYSYFSMFYEQLAKHASLEFWDKVDDAYYTHDQTPNDYTKQCVASLFSRYSDRTLTYNSAKMTAQGKELCQYFNKPLELSSIG